MGRWLCKKVLVLLLYFQYYSNSQICYFIIGSNLSLCCFGISICCKNCVFLFLFCKWWWLLISSTTNKTFDISIIYIAANFIRLKSHSFVLSQWDCMHVREIFKYEKLFGTHSLILKSFFSLKFISSFFHVSPFYIRVVQLPLRVTTSFSSLIHMHCGVFPSKYQNNFSYSYFNKSNHCL